MMKKTTTCYIFLLISYLNFAQNWTPFQDKESQKWGYRTSKDVILEPTFDYAGHFYKDYAWIKEGNNWGIILKDKNNYVVEPQFKEIKRLDDYTFWVKDKEKMWGIMNYDGKWVQPCKYQSLAFWETYLNPTFMLYKKSLPDWDTVLFRQNDSLGFMTRTGEVLKKLPYHHVVPFEDTSGFTVVCMLDNYGKAYKWGVINRLGAEIIPCIYDDLGNKWGLESIDLKSRRLNSDNIYVRLGEQCGYFNFRGEIIVPLQNCKN